MNHFPLYESYDVSLLRAFTFIRLDQCLYPPLLKPFRFACFRCGRADISPKLLRLRNPDNADDTWGGQGRTVKWLTAYAEQHCLSIDEAKEKCAIAD